MKINKAIGALAVAVVIGIGGGAIWAGVNAQRDANPPATPPASPPSGGTATTSPPAGPGETESPSSSESPTGGTTTGGTSPSESSATPDEPLAAENVIYERVYYDVTGHSFTRVEGGAGDDPPLSPCEPKVPFSDQLPDGYAPILSAKMTGPDHHYVTEAVTAFPLAATASDVLDVIATRFEACARGIEGGDFGYGDKVTITTGPEATAAVFPAYDSGAPAGGYIVLRSGGRVGVIDVTDAVSVTELDQLARVAVEILGA